MEANKDVNRQQAGMLARIQQREFALLDLNLFLDTHPDEQQALELYDRLHQELMQLIYQYEQMYGPLLNFGMSPARQSSWLWVETPWPWEI